MSRSSNSSVATRFRAAVQNATARGTSVTPMTGIPSLSMAPSLPMPSAPGSRSGTRAYSPRGTHTLPLAVRRPGPASRRTLESDEQGRQDVTEDITEVVAEDVTKDIATEELDDMETLAHFGDGEARPVDPVLPADLGTGHRRRDHPAAPYRPARTPRPRPPGHVRRQLPHQRPRPPLRLRRDRRGRVLRRLSVLDEQFGRPGKGGAA